MDKCSNFFYYCSITYMKMIISFLKWLLWRIQEGFSVLMKPRDNLP